MDSEAYERLEWRLVALARSSGPLRAALAQLGAWLVEREAWKPLGYARLSDYADEGLGRSARSLRDLAHVGQALSSRPQLRAALVSGELGWTKVRLLARVCTSADEGRWIAYARGVSSAALSREVRKVDTGSLERGGFERERGGRHWFQVACTPEMRLRWHQARSAARRVHGGRVSFADCVEMITAEVISALPLDPDAVPGDDGVEESESRRDADTQVTGADGEATLPEGGDAAVHGDTAASIPAAIEALLSNGEKADALELHRRLRAALEMERLLDAWIGPLLELLMRRRIYWLLGFTSRDAYVRERLGLDPSWGRALLRVERAARASPAFAAAYREGRLSALQATTLVPLVLAELAEDRMAAWIEHARGVSLRKLRDDVDVAVMIRETDWERWLRAGGLPEDGACTEEGPSSVEREIGAQGAPQETCTVGCQLELDVIRLLRAVLCTVQRRLEREMGRRPTRGEALGAMIDHAMAEWGGDVEKVPRKYRVFARDGWRCVIPVCTSMRSLHDHHIVFRSAGGGNELENRVTLCAFHHLRGVHAGLVRVTGRAPDRLRFELPLAVYASGDRLLATL